MTRFTVVMFPIDGALLAYLLVSLRHQARKATGR